MLINYFFWFVLGLYKNICTSDNLGLFDILIYAIKSKKAISYITVGFIVKDMCLI